MVSNVTLKMDIHIVYIMFLHSAVGRESLNSKCTASMRSGTAGFRVLYAANRVGESVLL